MKDQKFTKGPWGLEVDSTNCICIVNEHEDRICDVIADNEDDLLTETEWANAKLIAAAPELLFALKECVYAMEYGDSNEKSTRELWLKIIAAGDNAIFKALGE